MPVRSVPGGRSVLALVEVEGHRVRGQPLADAAVAFAREGLGPSVADHAVDAPLLRQARDDLGALARHRQQPGAPRLEGGRERAQRLEQELHPVGQLPRPVGREEVRVEDEEGDDLAGGQRASRSGA